MDNRIRVHEVWNLEYEVCKYTEYGCMKYGTWEYKVCKYGTWSMEVWK